MSRRRLTSDVEGMVIACPECDQAGCIHSRSDALFIRRNPEDEYYCDKCSSTFDEYNERERYPPAKGNAKYEDLTLEDVGLSPKTGP